MAGDPKGLFQTQLRTLFAVGTPAGYTDGQLLERFATRPGDEASELAFAALVERHGPMVLRVCRGILRDEHEAMDAFQATFLVLARRGRSLWVRDSLAPWLHRVACHAARRSRAAAARRRALEQRAAAMTEPRNQSGDADQAELAALIHEEVDRLPERFRAAVVLCDLEGRTCEEAARHLGCPVGTLGSRLARGRQRLRDRLGRRGLAPHAGLLIGASARPALLDLLPPDLVGSTASAAARFASTRAAAQGAAASIALEVIRSMTLAHLGKAAIVALALAASTTGVVALERRHAAVAQAPRPDPPQAQAGPARDAAVIEVRPGKLNVVIDERGGLEPTHATDLPSTVKGQHRIVSVLPEGSRVATGQVVCELDPGELKDELADQKIAATNAEAAYVRAKLAREIAEIAVTEYVDGDFRKELQSAERDVKLAEKSVARAEERLKRTHAARESLEKLLAGQGAPKNSTDLVAKLDLDDRMDAAAQALDRDRSALELAQTKRQLLQKFTRTRTVKQLQADLVVARSEEIAREQVWVREGGKQKRLERQIDDCKLVAPHDGVLVYHDERRIPGGGAGFSVEVGAEVRERQKLLTVIDLHVPMRVNTKVHEAVVDQLRPGMTALVTVDTYPDEVFLGTVKAVAPRPDKPRNLDGGIRVYTTLVELAEAAPGLRPGMTALASITVASRDNVLAVPVDSLVLYDGEYHVAVKRPDGHVDWREVRLGLGNGKMVEVQEGLKTGDSVVLEPAPFLSEEQKRKVAESKPPARRRARAAGKREVRP